MSSRALRRAQKEREQEQLEQQALAAEREEEEEDEEVVKPAAKPSIFAMLQAEEDEEDENEEEEEASGQPPEDAEETHAPPPSTSESKAARKKGKKKKGKGKAQIPAKKHSLQEGDRQGSADDIDRALASLGLEKSVSFSRDIHFYQTTNPGDSRKSTSEMCKVLSINQHDLVVSNELRRLFGRDAVAAEHADEMQRATGRRRNHNAGQEGVSLAEAVTGKYSIGGSGLSKVLIKRNPFVTGRVEWPKVAVNGLGMEVIEKQPDDITMYAFTRGREYMNAEFNFIQYASSGDPNTMVGLIRQHPYHVGTLLRVAEISRIMDKDNATAGDLLERALFAFGRALHPSFGHAMAQGKARLNFSRAENREFYLAAWKYIANIGLRATWRTAYEWSRLLLSLNPEDDPYCMRLVIDQYAIRSKQGQSLLDLSNQEEFREEWAKLPNIAYSRSLALKLVGKAEEAQEALSSAIENFPWVAARLYQELQLDKLPKFIWGKQAPTELDNLLSELYVTEGLDIWKVPNNLKFLTDIATALVPFGHDTVHHERSISRDEARLILLIDKPALTTLVPYSLKSKLTSQLDPLPPDDDSGDEEDDDISDDAETANVDPDDLIRDNPRGFFNELRRLGRFLERLVPGSGRAADDTGDGGQRVPIGEDTVSDALARAHMTVDELQGRVRRLLNLREALERQPGGRVRIDNQMVVAVVPREGGNPDIGVTIDEIEDQEEDEDEDEEEEDDEFHDANER